jgi:aspartyl-tRNA synthetase
VRERNEYCAFDVTRLAAQLATEYEGRLAEGEEDEELMSCCWSHAMRRLGKLAFLFLQDGSGTIQLQFDTYDAFKVS